MKRKILRCIEMILPRYAWIPLASALLLNFLAYFVSRLVTAQRHHYQMWTLIDDLIPFLTGFVIIYLLAFAQWIIGYILIARESRKVCFSLFSAELIAKLICLFCFLIIPTAITRPEVTGSGLCAQLTRLTYRMDAPNNLFPSIHCLESWFCFRGALRLKKVPAWYAPVCLVMTLLVFASTVCVKQHVFVDIPAAVITAEAAIWFGRRIGAERIFPRLKTGSSDRTFETN